MNSKFQLGKIYERTNTKEWKPIVIDKMGIQTIMDNDELNDLFEGVNILQTVTYNLTFNLLFWLDTRGFDNPTARNEYIKEKYLVLGKDRYSKQFNPLSFNVHRSSFDKLVKEVLIPLEEIRYLNEEVLFQLNDTINTSLKTLEVYFDKLDDTRLEEEVERLARLVKGLYTLHKETLNETKVSVSSGVGNVLDTSLKKHKELVDSATRVLELMNKST